MKSVLHALVPNALMQPYKRWRLQQARRRRQQRMTTEEIFTDIYENSRWGGAKGEFNSGDGSRNAAQTDPYVARITELADREGFYGLCFVDLGCGDFQVGRRLQALAGHYVGVDIVRPLVEDNRERFGAANVDFVHLDIVDDPLPDGDVCFVRQVFQHLSNAQIAEILKKLKKYRWVFVTEHVPTDNPAIVPNVDKPAGDDVRVDDNSGVFLDQPPFNVLAEQLLVVLEVPGTSPPGWDVDAGVIRTLLYRPSSAASSLNSGSSR